MSSSLLLLLIFSLPLSSSENLFSFFFSVAFCLSCCSYKSRIINDVLAIIRRLFRFKSNSAPISLSLSIPTNLVSISLNTPAWDVIKTCLVIVMASSSSYFVVVVGVSMVVFVFIFAFLFLFLFVTFDCSEVANNSSSVTNSDRNFVSAFRD